MKHFLSVLLALCALPVMAQRTGPTNITSAVAPNDCVSLSVNAAVSSTVYIDVDGTFNAILQPQVVRAGGVAKNLLVHATDTGASQATITAAGGYWAPVAATDTIKVCATTYTSGTASVSLTVGTGVASSALGGGGGGSVTSLAAGGGIALTPNPIVGVGTIATNFGGSLNAFVSDNGSGIPAEVAGPTTPTGVVQVWGSVPSGGVAGANQPLLAGVTPRASTCTANADTILVTDRAGYVTWSDASACAVTLPQAGSTGFASNFVFDGCNIGAGTVTITPTTSTISYVGPNGYSTAQASMPLTANQCAFIYSNNTNYFALSFGNVMGVDSGAANAYVVTGSALTSLTVTGVIGCFNPTHASTGATTVNFNGLGATTVVKFTNAAIANNDIVVNNPACMFYNGTNFVLTNPIASTGTNKVVLSNSPTLATATNTGPLTSGTAGSLAGFIDLGAGFLTANMTAQSSATCTNVTNMTWTIAANKNYILSCRIARTLAASATLAYCLGGPGTATSYTLDVQGANGAAGAWADLSTSLTSPVTAYGSKTTASAAAANSSLDIVTANIQNGSTASGTALTLQTAANGTNNITVLADSSCRLTQVN